MNVLESKSTRFSIEKIGIEFELNMDKSTIRDFYTWKVDYKWNTFDVDNEYYQNQIELKSPLNSDIQWSIERFRDFIFSYNRLTIWGNIVWSPYVWTHIHFKILNNWLAFEWFKWVRLRVAEYMFKRLYEYYNAFWSLSIIEIEELRRITRNHNILRYFDFKFLWDWLRRNLNEKGMDYPNFANWCGEKPKYQPVIWSLANEWGKPHTLELRLIPNTYFLFAPIERLMEDIAMIETIMNENKYTFTQMSEMKNSIIETHKKILLLT